MSTLLKCTPISYQCGKICLSIVKTCRKERSKTIEAQLEKLKEYISYLEGGGVDRRKGISLPNTKKLQKIAEQLQSTKEPEAVAVATKLPIGRVGQGREGFVTTEAHNQWTTGYLARLQEGGNLEIQREFQKPDETDLSRAGNGNKHYEISSLPDGVYEAESVTRSYQSGREYFRVKDGKITAIYNSQTEALESIDQLYTRRQKKKAEEQERLKAKQEELKLPELQGSQKQVAWALSIRDDLLSKLTTFTESADPDNPAVKRSLKRLAQSGFSISPEEYLKFFKKGGKIVAQKNSASFWIDRRSGLQNIIDAIDLMILNALKEQAQNS